MLTLEDLEGMSRDTLRDHFVTDYEADRGQVDKYNVLIAYESVGSWGCDSSSWFLLKDKETGDLFEVNGGHCSCFGFEGQFEPKPTTTEYLLSDKFYLCCGGYDGNAMGNKQKVREELERLFGRGSDVHRS